MPLQMHKVFLSRMRCDTATKVWSQPHVRPEKDTRNYFSLFKQNLQNKNGICFYGISGMECGCGHTERDLFFNHEMEHGGRLVRFTWTEDVHTLTALLLQQFSPVHFDWNESYAQPSLTTNPTSSTSPSASCPRPSTSWNGIRVKFLKLHYIFARRSPSAGVLLAGAMLCALRMLRELTATTTAAAVAQHRCSVLVRVVNKY